jgi:hypothetical protein
MIPPFNLSKDKIFLVFQDDMIPPFSLSKKKIFLVFQDEYNFK